MNTRTWSVAVLAAGLIALAACVVLIQTRSTTFIEVNDANFEAQVLKSPIPVYLEIYASGCGPCSRQLPIIEKVAKDYQGKVRFARANASASPQIASVLKLKLVPTHLFFRPADGSGVTAEGVLDEPSLRKFLDEGLAPPAPKPASPDTNAPQAPAAPAQPPPTPNQPTAKP